MVNRNSMSQTERHNRSKLAKLLHNYDFLRGSLVVMARTCGKKKCKCLKGQKHKSLYLAIRVATERKMICIPKQLEPTVRCAVLNYKTAVSLMDDISQASLNRIFKKGHRGCKNDG